jgi:hypothetical protein
MKKLLFIYVFFSLNQFIWAQNDDFILCGDQKTYPYYYPELKYKGEFYELKSQIINQLDQSIFNNKTNGIIIIQFHVNCEGRTGNFKLKQTDLDYKDTILDEVLTQKLVETVKTLKDWIPAKNENNETVNSHKFLSFRFEGGVLVDILPN